jgi:hypothetical protein
MWQSAWETCGTGWPSSAELQLLFFTDKATPDVRVTADVDVIVEIASRGDYYRIAESLRSSVSRKIPVRERRSAVGGLTE